MKKHFERINAAEYDREKRRDAALFLVPIVVMALIGVASLGVLIMGGL